MLKGKRAFCNRCGEGSPSHKHVASAEQMGFVTECEDTTAVGNNTLGTSVLRWIHE